jgi:hypothetical protein
VCALLETQGFEILLIFLKKACPGLSIPPSLAQHTVGRKLFTATEARVIRAAYHMPSHEKSGTRCHEQWSANAHTKHSRCQCFPMPGASEPVSRANLSLSHNPCLAWLLLRSQPHGEHRQAGVHPCVPALQGPGAVRGVAPNRRGPGQRWVATCACHLLRDARVPCFMPPATMGGCMRGAHCPY